jgi:fatty acid desaturase
MTQFAAILRGLFFAAGVPTWLVLAACYSGLVGLLLVLDSLPWFVVMPWGAWLVAWYGSLQHEAVHGHIAPWRPLNDVLAWAPLGVFVPFAIYRESHLAHHQCKELTFPGADPESFYVTEAQWGRMAWPLRVVLSLNNTLLGRFVFGPAIEVFRLWRREAGSIAAGDTARLATCVVHGCAVAAFLGAIWVLCDVGPATYILLFAYPGFSVILLRSYLEHRPATAGAHRTAIVEAGPVMSLLFLNNNLHAVHHHRPELPWYKLPAAYRRDRAAYLRRNGGYVLPRYEMLIWRYLVRPKDGPVHPAAALSV